MIHLFSDLMYILLLRILSGQGMNTVYEPCADVNQAGGVNVLDATLVNLVVLMGKDALNTYLGDLGMDLVHTGEPVVR